MRSRPLLASARYRRRHGSAPRHGALDRVEALRPNRPGEKLLRLAEILTVQEPAMYSHLVSHWKDPEALVLRPQRADHRAVRPRPLGRHQRLLAADDVSRYSSTICPTTSWSRSTAPPWRWPGGARAVPSEPSRRRARWSLPPRMKRRKGESKWLCAAPARPLRAAPRIERKKMGFSVPTARGCADRLRQTGAEIPGAPRIAADGLFDAAESIAAVGRASVGP